MKQLYDIAAGLRPDVQKMMPDKALTASLSMSAAFSIYWAERFGQPQLTLSFRATGHLAAGQALYDTWRDASSDPGNDQSLIDAWASKLGLQGWYHWVPSQSPT